MPSSVARRTRFVSQQVVPFFVCAALALPCIDAAAIDVTIGNMTSTVSPVGDSGLSVNMAALVQLVIKAVNEDRAHRDRINQDRSIAASYRVKLGSGEQITGVGGLDAFGGAQATSTAVQSLGNGVWQVDVHTALNDAELVDLQCPQSLCPSSLPLMTVEVSLPPAGGVAPFIQSGAFYVGGYTAQCSDGVICVAAVPEPASFGLMATGLLGLLAVAARRARSASVLAA